MVNLGFSLYPENYPVERSCAYIDLLSRYGAKRLFLSLLQIDQDTEVIFKKYQEVISYANAKNIKVVADISPAFIKANGWEDNLLEKAYQFGLSGLRLDESLAIDEIVALTQNNYGIKIELNTSTEKQLLQDLIDKGADKNNIMGCHNFYPHRYTGLSRDHFLQMSRFYKEHGVESSVFVSSNTATEGPWPLSEGLPTLEDLRDLPISLQADIYKATNLFDNIIISNQFISEEELAILSETLQRQDLVFEYLPEKVLEVEQAILASPHHYRGDISDYVIRSTQTRVLFKNESIPPRVGSSETCRGMITIDNDEYSRYKGELQIALKSYPLSSKVNVVGCITAEYLILLDFIQPWQGFLLRTSC